MERLDVQHRDYFSVSFRIISDGLEPSEITSLLGIEPDKAHRKGDPNTSITKKGKVMHYAPFRFGVWRIESKLDKYCKLQDHLTNVIERLEPKKDILAKLKVDGFEMDFSCGYLFSEEDQPSIFLSNEMLKRMAGLGVDLGISLYPLSIDCIGTEL